MHSNLPDATDHHSNSAQNAHATNLTVAISWRWLLLSAVCVAVIVVAGGWLAAGKTGVEKSASRLLMPIGFTWLLLWGWWLQFALRGYLRKAVLPLLIWVCFTVTTTSPLGNECVRWLESSVRSFQPQADEPLDLLVVLGGGTHQGPWRAEAASAGDRVLYAAQLYVQKRVKRLVTTGDRTPGLSHNKTSPREQTIEIWTQLGIPIEDIDALHGQNTYMEIQSLKKMAAEQDHLRVGLLTSATHLPRAVRLAKAQGVDVLPIAADHQANLEGYNYFDFIPTAGALNHLVVCQHEFMAWFVNR